MMMMKMKRGAQRLFSSSNACRAVKLTPGQAGRRAEELARKMRLQQQQDGRTSSNVQMDTILAHAGISGSSSHDKDMSHNSMENIPLAPPMNFATTYTRAADGTYPASSGTGGGSVYSRIDNPTRRLLEEHVAILECHGGGPAFEKSNEQNPAVCCAFASGMMAMSSIILAHKAPTRVLLPIDLYHGVSTVLLDVFSRFQVTVERVDMRNNLVELRQSLEKAAPAGHDVIVWLETPSNPLCHVLDIQAISQLVRDTTSSSSAVTVVVDSTLAPPTIQQPLLHGADVVLHAATKYLAGHSDALVGVVTVSPWTERGQVLGPILQQVHQSVGGVASTMDSWLTLRGLRTLSTRVTRQCQTAMTLATFLQKQPSVSAVYYPGLPSSSLSSSSTYNGTSREQAEQQHEIAHRQMRAFGGVLSVEMESECHAMALAGALQTIYRATSLGGTETLIEHRRSIEPPDRATSPPGLLRISVGLEDANDLIQDLKQALDIAQIVVNENEAQD